MTSGRVPEASGVARFVEQHCEDCEEQTDQEVGPGAELAACLRCGRHNRVLPEEDRVRELVRRVHEEEHALLERLRSDVAPAL